VITKEVLKQVRRIEIKTGRLVSETFAGQYESIFKGRGMEFSEVRDYIAGDDIRSIDWNVTARYGKPFIKKFVEERELTVVFLIDMSGSEFFGTDDKAKNELTAEIVSLLSLSAMKNNDKVGLICFSDRIEKFITPKKGLKHVSRILREIITFAPLGKKTDIKKALEYLNEVLKRKAVVFLISDFLDTDYEKALKITVKKHDLITVRIIDKAEEELKDIGIIELEDAETGEFLAVDTSNKEFQRAYAKQRQEFREKFKKLLKSAGSEGIELKCGESYIKPIINFFKARALRLR
jgi:uncharacterized protein (DUF58 family)